MDLREGEQILKTYRHHPTPFARDLLKIIVGFFPFFLLLYLFGPSISTLTFVIAHIVLVVLLILIIIYQTFVYWLDKLIVTNYRIVHVDWRYLTVRNEYEAELSDIQDIATKEKGILATFRIFDYGEFRLKTASNDIIINFSDAPNPEGIRQFVYKIKPN